MFLGVRLFLFRLGLFLGFLSFWSCSQDEDSVVASSGGSVSFSVSLGFDGPEAEEPRSLSFRLEDVQGQAIPRPQFRDGEEVLVHTAIKSSVSGSRAYVSTLKWVYNSNSRRLVLSPSASNAIEIPNFNNNGGVRWYMSALLASGTRLDGTRVSFEGTRELRSVDGSLGASLGELNVPYGLGWTELKIDTNSARVGASYTRAVLSSTSASFRPMGSLIGYRFGNKLRDGVYSFTSGGGFRVTSNAFGDRGVFDLNGDVPRSAGSSGSLPSWTGEDGGMYYRFAPGEAPGVLSHQSTSDKLYYAWVMPHGTSPSRVDTRVILDGVSSNPLRSYTKRYFTDYSATGKRSEGRVQSGRIHLLTAHATHGLVLPIEYVTDYNLAGAFSATPPPDATHTIEHTAGMRGPLRFAESHDNDQSGYYNAYQIQGSQPEIIDRRPYANPEGRNLQREIDQAFGAGRYVVPNKFLWNGVFPVTQGTWEYMDFFVVMFSSSQYHAMYVHPFFLPGYDADAFPYNLNYLSGDLFLSASSFQLGSGNDASYLWGTDEYAARNGVLYSIRFKKAHVQEVNTEDRVSFTPLSDNRLRCAYRYVFTANLEGMSEEERKLHNALRVDVVYLGEDATKMSDIYTPAWWSQKETNGEVISRAFPMVPSQSYFNSTQMMGQYGYYYMGHNLGYAVIYNDYMVSHSHDTRIYMPLRLFHAM